MRQIGTLPTEMNAQNLADHLIAIGITNRVVAEGDQWAIWVYNEDQVASARVELDAFRANPNDPRYQAAKDAALAVEREKQKLDKLYRRNVRDLSGRWDRPNFRGRPLTSALMAISIAVYLLTNVFHNDFDLTDKLLFCSFDPVNHTGLNGLNQILHGQVWRVITPIFLHFSVLHILFNMLWLKSLGTLIESRRGTKTLALLVLLSAVSSNVAEFAYESTRMPLPGNFGGMSGVVYALFGYVWMKGRSEPEQGMIMSRQNVQIMLFFLVLCMVLPQIIGPVANVAHVVGLIVGMLYGLARL